MKDQVLTIDDLVELCEATGIRSHVPYSQLEAEAVWQNVDILTVIRRHVLAHLARLGIVQAT